jgi:ribose 5-phosphate isomerase A
VPVEVTQFGWQATAVALAKLGCTPERRYTAGEQPYVTDSGNYILDCRFGPLPAPGKVERDIAMTVGTVESGLFVGRSSMVVVASPTGVEVLTPPARAGAAK